MALRAVPEHPKFFELKMRLSQPKGAVLGWLETIWHFTGKFTPCGNIGKYSDQAIEMWAEWNGEPGALMAALVASGWIDESSEFRLLVHDWHIHADNATKLAVKRSGKKFCRHSVETDCDTTSTMCGLPVPEPEPEPEPVPEPDIKQKQKPSRVRAARDQKKVDVRFGPFKDLYFEHTVSAAEAEPSWGGREATALSKYLAETPKITLIEWQRILSNRANSDIPQGEPLSAWIKNARMFWKEPIDRFGKPRSSNGKFAGKTESTIEAARAAIAQTWGNRGAFSETGDPPAGKVIEGRFLSAG